MEEFDLVVIGGGPAGYVGAIKASQLGMKVACVEKRKALGGTCLNVGCIPSKALLHSSHLYHETEHNMSDNGIKISGLKLDLAQMMKRKEGIVSDLCKGISGLFAKNKITHIIECASFQKDGTVKAGKQILKAKNYLICTGSNVATLPNITIDEKKIISSDSAISLKEVPSKMLVIGGGVIGLEMASVWSRLGSDVTVVEYCDRILPGMDGEISKEFKKILESQGINFLLSTKVTSCKTEGKSVTTEVESDGKTQKLKSDIVLVAVGRAPYTQDLGLENVNITTTDHKAIKVDEHFKTSHENIYAVGDVIGGQMLAHKAEEEAIAAVEIMAGQAGHINYSAIPGVVYTFPEVASVGKTQEQLKEENVEYKIGKFPMLANSRARATGCASGFVKILSCKKTDKILGAHIISASAGELIQEIAMGIEYSASSEDIARISHAHPGLNEAVKEAALAAFFKSINF